MAYSNSSFVSIKKLSPNHSGLRTHAIDTITIHCMSEPLTASSCGDLFSSPSKGASSNYGIGPDGKVGLYVEEKNRSWCTSNQENDDRAVTIEVSSEEVHPYAVKAAAYESLIRLVADVCIRNGIKKLKWTTNKYDRMNHVDGCNMTVHRDYANKSCPGDYLYSRMGEIARRANAFIAKGKVSGINTQATNNKIAWDFLVGVAGFSKESAASCIGFWLAENGYPYGASYPNVTPPYTSPKCPYKYLTQELFPGEVEGYYMSSFPGNKIVMGNLPKSLNDYTNAYLSGYGYGGYCGIGVGSWTFKYGSGALIQYAKDRGKSWDSLDLQLNFAVDTYSGKYAPYGTVGIPSAYEKRGQSHGCTESNFWPGIAWFVAWEWPSYYGNASACRSHFGDKYELTARNVYKEFKDSVIGDYSMYGDSSFRGGVVSDPNDVINAEAIDALIISLDENVKKVDYAKLLDNHVSGVIMKAGSYFTEKHKVATSFVNPNLKLQIDEAVKAGVRFGLYVDVRSRSIKEAEKECEQLYYVISKYPPALGLWLHLMFTQSKTTNHKILDYYLEQLQDWGFMKGCGLYCTKEELDKIDWDKYQNDFFLWYVDRFTSSSQLEELDRVLTPEFFTIH